ncbi:MAG TPA: hypothetical protein VFB19_18635 [Mycobacterium sp.]|nr:hypothetical protein [Mycobacterium sp.]
MAELALLRLLIGAKVWTPFVALPLAAATTDTTGTTPITVAIISGAFTLVAGLITATVALRRTRDPDISELLALHDRVTVVETNLADLRDDVRELLRRRR